MIASKRGSRDSRDDGSDTLTQREEHGEIIGAFFAYQGLIKHTLFSGQADLTKSQIMIMCTINELGAANMGELAQRIAVSREQATRAVQPLAKAGYVERRHNEENRRTVTVSLTCAGTRLLLDYFDFVDQRISQELQALTDQERRQLVETSRRANDLLCKAMSCGKYSEAAG